MRPDDALFPLFPMQNSIPKSITLRGDGDELEKRGKWRRRGERRRELGERGSIWPQL